MEFCNCNLFCCALPYVNSSFAIILMLKRNLVALLSLLFGTSLQCHGFWLQFVIVIFHYHNYYFWSFYIISTYVKSIGFVCMLQCKLHNGHLTKTHPGR